MSRTQVTIDRQRLRDLAAQLHIVALTVAIAGRFPVRELKEHPLKELERIEAELRSLARES